MNGEYSPGLTGYTGRTTLISAFIALAAMVLLLAIGSIRSPTEAMASSAVAQPAPGSSGYSSTGPTGPQGVIVTGGSGQEAGAAYLMGEESTGRSSIESDAQGPSGQGIEGRCLFGNSLLAE